MMEVLSALRVTSLTSKFPGVSATAAPPVTAIEYRWFQPFCSEANTIRFPTTKCRDASAVNRGNRSEEHTSELQSLAYLVCRLLLEKKKKKKKNIYFSEREYRSTYETIG